MREIFIKYNPYRLETVITVDGAVPKENSRLNFGEEKRLQEWIEELPSILFEECSERDFEITFHGTLLDYEDVEAMAREANKGGFHIVLTHIPAKEVSDKEAAIDEIFHEIQAGPFDELKKPDLSHAFEMARNSDFEVNVVATMSAGKSTLINALLGRKLMPSKQEACTATITEIKDNDAGCFWAKVYDAKGNLIRTVPELSLEIMSSLNNDPRVSKIRVEGNVPFVTADDISLVLVDTPGPNNSRDLEHQAATYRMLSESSKTVVLYILNATQLAVNDDYNLLSYVAESMKVGGKQSRDRFIFVLNKLDQFRSGEDSVEDSMAKVRAYLHDNGIENANIYPASALTALDIRTILADSGDYNEDDVDQAELNVKKFNRNTWMHFEKLASLTPSARKEIEARLAEAIETKDSQEAALIHCGIIPIEMAIKAYVQKYAKTAKIKNIVDTFSKRLESAGCLENTKREIAENKDKQKEILDNIEVIKRKLASGDEAKLFKSRIAKINYDTAIDEMAKNINMTAQGKITKYISTYGSKISKHEAEELCEQFARFAEGLQAEVQVKFEDIIENNVRKSAAALLEEYRRKISDLAQDLNVSDVSIDPFQLMSGEICGDISALINDMTESETVKVGETWIANTARKWYKPWTWFQERGHWKDVYEEKEYVDEARLAYTFFAPIQERLFENGNCAVNYAKEQARKVKQAFSKKFDELDAVLKDKLQDLEDCAKDKENAERRIYESQEKLKWLDEIQKKTNAILDI